MNDKMTICQSEPSVHHAKIKKFNQKSRVHLAISAVKPIQKYYMYAAALVHNSSDR